VSVDIYKFVRERLDEDARFASQASRKHGYADYPVAGVHWFWSTLQDEDAVLDRDEEFVGGDEVRVSLRSREEWPVRGGAIGRHVALPQFAIHEVEEVEREVGAFMVRFHPARILADVAAKRRTLDEHRPIDGRCHVCAAHHEGEWRRIVAPCFTVRDLAAPYQDHPDYDTEWSPA